jgi:hypothetical protein
LRPNRASYSPIARLDAQIVGFACIGRALRTRNVGGACPRRLSRGANSRLCPAPVRTRQGVCPTSRIPILKAQNPNEGRRLKRRAKARLFGFSAAASAGLQPFRRQNSRRNRENPAPGGIDPNAKQVLHKECVDPWQGFSHLLLYGYSAHPLGRLWL